MRHVHYLEGKEFRCDSEIAFSHVILGQRDETKEVIEAPKDMAKATPGEIVARKKYVFNSTHGWYAMKLLAWCKSEEEASTTSEEFKQNWINVSVQPISNVVIYG